MAYGSSLIQPVTGWTRRLPDRPFRPFGVRWDCGDVGTQTASAAAGNPGLSDDELDLFQCSSRRYRPIGSHPPMAD